jgi:hypothetical protein
VSVQQALLCRVSLSTLGKASVTITCRRHDDFSLLSTRWHSIKTLSSVRNKALGKETAAVVQVTETSLPRVTLDKEFGECFLYFSEWLRHSAKQDTMLLLKFHVIERRQMFLALLFGIANRHMVTPVAFFYMIRHNFCSLF